MTLLKQDVFADFSLTCFLVLFRFHNCKSCIVDFQLFSQVCGFGVFLLNTVNIGQQKGVSRLIIPQ